ncbi:hypothetical protein KAFR_0D04920 [Kazachstania africana CBS 2517]|uniref:Secreted protein CSS2 C-terminal domain-containing protein n=1 Tax=Kazachstania africana (strain ATCC 22294 / BCRC 22015 / CBS 2517 / CECT 1963 / NBRC 1671 / NRRL Y-8276) TaxID=1071382 RepID=H2AUT9_KAZAF|nr:hypothetical protein KAFR_0D04920 [Kazachstania africana CBS 2517]CCF58139.1 hypothetical protein KAFR_0D04920 [Kazachstania africana CBS 2517]
MRLSLVNKLLCSSMQLVAFMSLAQANEEYPYLNALGSTSTGWVLQPDHFIELDLTNETIWQLYKEDNATEVPFTKWSFNGTLVSSEQFDMNVFNTTTDLFKRRNVDICWKKLFTDSVCTAVTNYATEAVTNIAHAVYVRAHAGTCGVSEGSSAGVYYKYWASSGHCASTVEEKTIDGAVQWGFDEWVTNGSMCATYTLSLSHGGSWLGYLVLGPSASVWFTTTSVPSSSSCYSKGCGTAHAFDKC